MKVVQANLSITYPCIARTWYRHSRGQVDYFLVVRGSVKVCVYKDATRHLVEVVLSKIRPQILRVPGHYWHSFKVVSNKPAYLVYFVNRLYDHQNSDEERCPWNDQTIIPILINGKSNDHCPLPAVEVL